MGLLSSLSNRIFLGSAALTLFCMGIAIYLVNVRVIVSAEDELQRVLVQTGAFVDQQRATMSDVFNVQARLVADLPKLKAAVDTGDPPTVEPVAEEYQRQLGSDLFLVTDRTGRVLASIPREAPDRRLASLPTIREAQAGRESATFFLVPRGILQVVSVPIAVGTAPPEILGTLSVGFLLGDSLAARLKNVTGSEVAFAAGGKVLASTLPPDSRAALVPLMGTWGISRVSVGGSDYLALLLPLASPRKVSEPGAGPAAARPEATGSDDGTMPAAIILQSRTDRLRFLRPIQAALGLTGIIAVLLATGIGYAIARTVTRPLGVITATMKEIAATGDLNKKIVWRARQWEDEDAKLLAGTFNTLTDSIARFQREAGERERLSALGRLSTIIAHEVRNPLMIIKASLRPLERESVPAEDVRSAVADIADEVARLNRLVNEVLDFARPIRYELTEADINRVCEESAAAAAAGDAGAPVHLALDPALPPAVTDTERLRSVLVNVLVNARHAVQALADRAAPPDGIAAARPPEPSDRDVELTTSAALAGRLAITVRDRGVGIPPDELARVFEPYFTTKRGGTGLGLAISRNIIEGLGGTITVASRVDVGTEVRIELPRTPDIHRVGNA
jgi:signal transduction histidine kinase